jgi:fucose 4-O-acetylase-like acetyltransferase
MENQQTSNRILYLDCCKGFAIIAVVLGHIADGYLKADIFNDKAWFLESLFNVIYLFHMPLFFCLSGMAFYIAYCRKKNTKKWMIQLANLIWDYFLFSAIMWVMKFVFSGSVNNEVFIRDFFLLPVKPIGEYWFLYALSLFYIFAWFTSNNNRKMEVVILSIAFIVSCINAYIPYSGIFPIKTLIYYYVFFDLGTILGRAEINGGGILKKKAVASIAVLLTITSIIGVLYFHVNVSRLPVLATLCGTISMLAIIFVFRKYVSLSVLQILGKYSLDIYLLHSFFTAANRKLLFKMGIDKFSLNILSNFILSICLPIGISIVLKKFRIYRYFFKPFEMRTEKKR